MTELVDEPLTPLGFLHNTFLVVLSDTSGQFIIVHGRSVFPLAPKPGYTH